MNTSLSSALKCASALTLAMLVGCGENDGSADYQDGVAAYGAHDLKKAERLFAKSVARAPEKADGFLYLARTRLELGDLPAAREALARAMQLAPNDSDVRLVDAQVSYHSKDYSRAAKTFRALAEDRSLPDTVRAQGWAGLGVVEMTADNYDSARAAFLRAIRMDRRNVSARYHLGMLYRDNYGYPEWAIEQFSIYVRLDNVASPRVQKVQRTIIPELQKLVSQAAADRPGASRRNTGASAELIQKADVAFKRNSLRTARSLYAEALKADPLSYPAALGLAKTLQKSDATRSGQQQALSNYRLACSLRPSAVSTFLAAGELALRLGQFGSAVEIYSRAVAANPTSTSALDGLIRSLRKVGNRGKAAQAYQGYRDSLSVLANRGK